MTQFHDTLEPGTVFVEYSSNNSGGRWWLKDDDWRALEAAGWKVRWVKDEPSVFGLDKDGRWLGALARGAYRVGVSLGEAISEWEHVTKQCSNDLGCACCGAPHGFSAGRVRVKTAEEVEREREWEKRYPNRYPPTKHTYDSLEDYYPSSPSQGERYAQ